MANGRLDGWSVPETAALLPGQRSVLAAVNDFNARIVAIYPTVSQIDEDLPG
jgi:hypothetical protein